MNEQEVNPVTSNMIPGGEVVIPKGRIAAWRYRRALTQSVRTNAEASVGPRSASGITSYIIAVSNDVDNAIAETNANILVDRAREAGLFSVVRGTYQDEFHVLVEGDHDDVLRFVVDFNVRSHLTGVI